MRKLTRALLFSLCILVCQSALGESAGKATTPSKPPDNVPPLLVPVTPATPEPVRIVSVFGAQELKVYQLPFEDAYPTGPFERLDKDRYLFITKCGDVYFTQLEGELRLLNPAQPLTKPAAEGDKAVVYCKDSSGVKDMLLLDNALFVAYTTWDAENNGARMAVTEYELDADGLGLTYLPEQPGRQGAFARTANRRKAGAG